MKKGNHIYDKYGYLAGTDSNRAKDLMDMFIDDTIDAIICFRGGYGCIRLIPYLDLKLIRKHPKVFCGYSDITALLNLISNKCNFPTFHSPMINSNFNDQTTTDYFIKILSNSYKHIVYDFNIFNNISILNKQNFTGTLVGGNLSIIISTLCTPCEVKFKDSILLIEEINEPPYVIDRLLTQLLSSNKLKHCKAIILGQFTDCASSNINNFSIYDLICQKLLPLNIPIVTNFPSGHSYPNITLPIGCKLSYNSKSNTLSTIQNIFL